MDGRVDIIHSQCSKQEYRVKTSFDQIDGVMGALLQYVELRIWHNRAQAMEAHAHSHPLARSPIHPLRYAGPVYDSLLNSFLPATSLLLILSSNPTHCHRSWGRRAALQGR